MQKKSSSSSIIIIMAFFGILGIFGMAMTTSRIEVPKIVKNAFSLKYPNVKKVKWEMEEADEYEAEFELNGLEMSANFKKDGTWVGTETEIDEEDLPQAVKDGIATTFSGYELEEAERCENPNKVITYEVELENEADSEITAIFSSQGQLIKKEKEQEEEDENDN